MRFANFPKVIINITPKSYQSNWFKIESKSNKFSTRQKIKRQSNKKTGVSSPFLLTRPENFLINHYRDQALFLSFIYFFPVYEFATSGKWMPKCERILYFRGNFFHQTRSNCLDKDSTTHWIKFIVCLRVHILSSPPPEKMSNETQSKFLSSHQKRINSSHSRFPLHSPKKKKPAQSSAVGWGYQA